MMAKIKTIFFSHLPAGLSTALSSSFGLLARVLVQLHPLQQNLVVASALFNQALITSLVESQ